ncbi:MAG: hypothetical protein HYV42_04665 [Candidatus Magasanikbacteria bacterium]|nr:hypothetical protein [Candidatus Magasanikbacteria bacterium]
MVFDLINISEAENKLVVEAKNKYGKVYENAKNLVFLLWDFLKSAEVDAWIFVSFLSQVQKFAILSLLSTLRQHNAQSLMDMRQIFEAGVLAAYAIHERNDTTYYYKDQNDVAYVKEDAKEKSYKWLEENYKSHSDTIKNQKKIINNMWTHASILLTPLNFQLEKEEKFLNSVFDKEDEFQTKNDLWFLANSCWGLLDLFAKEIIKTKYAKLSDDFTKKMKQFGDDNEALKKELVSHPRIQKWTNIEKKS